MIPTINYLAVLLAAVASIVIGFLWYGPVFGKPWMKLMGFSKDDIEKAKKKGMTQTYVIMILGSLVMSYVLAHTTEFAMTYTKTYSIMGGLMSGFWTWLGFMAPIQMDEVLWGGKPWKLYFLNTGYRLASLLAMGVIIATWR